MVLNIPLREVQQYLQYLHTFALQDNSEGSQFGKNPIKTSMPKIPWVIIISCMQHCLFLQQHFIGSYQMILLNWERTKGKENNTTTTKLAEGN